MYSPNMIKTFISCPQKYWFKYENQISVPQRASYFEKGKNAFDLDAIYHLAICYVKGQGVHTDIKKGLDLYEIGAKRNHAKCIYNLAIHYQKGIGVNVDLKKAGYLFAKYQELSDNDK